MTILPNILYNTQYLTAMFSHCDPFTHQLTNTVHLQMAKKKISLPQYNNAKEEKRKNYAVKLKLFTADRIYPRHELLRSVM